MSGSTGGVTVLCITRNPDMAALGEWLFCSTLGTQTCQAALGEWLFCSNTRKPDMSGSTGGVTVLFNTRNPDTSALWEWMFCSSLGTLTCQQWGSGCSVEHFICYLEVHSYIVIYICQWEEEETWKESRAGYGWEDCMPYMFCQAWRAWEWGLSKECNICTIGDFNDKWSLFKQ